MSEVKITDIKERKGEGELTSEEFNYELALVTLIGSWDKNNKKDKKMISQIVNKGYDTWNSILDENKVLESAFDLSSFKNEQYKASIYERKKIWQSLDVKLSHTHLENFRNVAISVLKEMLSSDLLNAQDSRVDNVHSIQSLGYSQNLKEGLVGGLLLLTNTQYPHTSSEKNISYTVVHDVFKDADERRWKALAYFLPLLAQSAPKEFLNTLEKSLHKSPTFYKNMVSQRMDNNKTVADYLLWALEALAWQKPYINQVCLILGQMTDEKNCIQLSQFTDNTLEALLWEEYLTPKQIKFAPNKTSFTTYKTELMNFKKEHQPINVLRNIFCPWNLQTMASFEICQSVLKNLKDKQPEVAWHLMVGLLPLWRNNYTQKTYQPIFQSSIYHSKTEILLDNYLKWTQAYFDFAISIAGHDIQKLSHFTRMLYCFYPKSLIVENSPSTQVYETPVYEKDEMIDKDKTIVSITSTSPIQEKLDDLTVANKFPVLSAFLDHLSSKEISEIPESKRFELWNCLYKLTLLHRCSDKKWVFDDTTIVKIENTAEKLAPKNPLLFNRKWFSDTVTTHLMYQSLFPNIDHKNKEGEKKLNQLRKEAMKEIVKEGKVEGVIQFAKDVHHSEVGVCLAASTSDFKFDNVLLPCILDHLLKENEEVECLKSFLAGYIKQRQKDCDSLLSWTERLDQSKWTPNQISQFSEVVQQISVELQASQMWERISSGAVDLDEVKDEIERVITSNQTFYFLPYITQFFEKDRHIELKTDDVFTRCVYDFLRSAVFSEELLYNPEATGRLLYFVQVLYGKNTNEHDSQNKINLGDISADDPKFFCQIIYLSCLTYKNAICQIHVEQICQLLFYSWTRPPHNLRVWVNKLKPLCVKQEHLQKSLQYLGNMLATALVKKEAFTLSDSVSEWIDVLNSEKEIRQGFINTLSKKAEAVGQNAFSQFINGIQRASQKWKEGGYLVLSNDLDHFVAQLHLSSQIMERLLSHIYHFTIDHVSNQNCEVKRTSDDFQSFCEKIRTDINYFIEQKLFLNDKE